MHACTLSSAHTHTNMKMCAHTLFLSPYSQTWRREMLAGCYTRSVPLRWSILSMEWVKDGLVESLSSMSKILSSLPSITNKVKNGICPHFAILALPETA